MRRIQSTGNYRRHRWRRIVVAWLGLGLLVGGCEPGCDEPPPPGGVEGTYELSTAVPESAEVVVFSRRLDELVESVDTFVDSVPLSLPGAGDVGDWEAAGTWVEGPAVAFFSHGQWSVVAWADHERDIDLEAWPVDAQVQPIDSDQRDVSGWYTEADDERPGHWISSDGRRIGAGWLLEDGAAPLADTIWSIDEGQHWEVDAYLERLRQGYGEDNSADRLVFGAIDGAAMLEDFGGQGRAGHLIELLSSQVGTVYWAVERGESPTQLSIELSTPGRAELPIAIDDLGEARAGLPDLGGLVRAGAPGIVRLSVKPEQFVELLRSTLDVTERQRLDMTLDMLRDELEVDLREDFIANITGQAAVVIFGIEDSLFETEGLERVASTAALQTTREAVLIPFEDRDAMESVLDAFTQLSRGGLRREAGEHTIQYAWFDDSAPEWAIILHDDELAFVDSMVANDHIQRWMRSPRPLEDVFVERGVESMLGGTRGLGVYLDLATIRTMLKEGGDTDSARWLEPLDAIRLETDIDGRPERSEIELWLSDRVVEEDD